MSSTGAVGPDGIPLSAEKRCFAVIGPYLLRIVNARTPVRPSVTEDLFPKVWKTAEVVPHSEG